jgi:hypothetical protein
MSGPLELENRRLLPLVQQKVTGEEKADEPYDEQKGQDGQDQIERKAPL